MLYLPSQGKGSRDFYPCFTDSLASRWEMFELCISWSYHSLREKSSTASSLHWPALLHKPILKHWDGFFWVIWIKHCKMSCIFPSFGQNYSCNSIRMWNSEQPQWSSNFLAKTFLWKTIPFSVHNSSFSKASYRVWVKGALCQKKQCHTPSSLHSAWTCYFNSE